MVGHSYGHLLYHGYCLQDSEIPHLHRNYGIRDQKLEYLRADGPLNAGEVCLQYLAGPLVLSPFILVRDDHYLSGLGQLFDQLGWRNIAFEDHIQEISMWHCGWHLAGPDGEVDLLEDRSRIFTLVTCSFAELYG